MTKHAKKILSLSLLATSPAFASFSLSFSNLDFTSTPAFSNVSTFALNIETTEPLTAGTLYSDPGIANIQYSVSGSLTATPSGFPAFAFNLSDRFPTSPPITGTQFYALNPDALAGATISFQISPGANLLDGLQLNELEDLPSAQFGDNVILHFNGREKNTGRYHPMFLQLKSDGTGLLQNADNMGGNNPQDMSPDEIDVDFGEEYITNLTFNPAAVTLVVPEPQSALLTLSGLALAFAHRQRGTN